jgi:hypothetical protein
VASGVGDGAVDWLWLTDADSSADAEEIAYALRIRGVPARTDRAKRRGDGRGPWDVLVPDERLEQARLSLPVIWSAVLGSGPALTSDGACAFCDYDCRGLPPESLCPECGAALWSIAVKRAARRGDARAPTSD